MRAHTTEETCMSERKSERVMPTRLAFGFPGKLLSLVTLGGFALLSTGCATKPQVVEDEVVTTTTPPPAEEKPKERVQEKAPEPAADASRQASKPLEFPVVRFEFDSDLITADGRDALDAFAAEWRARGVARGLTIAGHADERGPEEYNLLLGQKRANSVRRYLSRLGVPDTALKAVSYGENRPLDLARNEEAYRINRRAEVQEN